MKKLLLLFMMTCISLIQAQNLSLTQDTVIEGDENYTFIRTNGWHLTVLGSLHVSSFVMLNKTGNRPDGGSIYSTDDMILSTNAFFFNDNGLLRSDTGISIGGHASGESGRISYCTFLFTNEIDSGIQVTQDCTLSLPEFDFNGVQNAIGLPYKLYSISGQQIESGIVTRETFNMRSETFLKLLVVEGYLPTKVPFNK